MIIELILSKYKYFRKNQNYYLLSQFENMRAVSLENYLIDKSIIEQSPMTDKYYLQLSQHSLLDLFKEAVKEILIYDTPIKDLPIIHLQKEIYLIYDNSDISEKDIINVIEYEVRHASKLQKQYLDRSFGLLEKQKSRLSDLREDDDIWSTSWYKYGSETSYKKSYAVVGILFWNSYQSLLKSIKNIKKLLEHFIKECLIHPINLQKMEKLLTQSIISDYFNTYKDLNMHQVLPILPFSYKKDFVFSSDFGHDIRLRVCKFDHQDQYYLMCPQTSSIKRTAQLPSDTSQQYSFSPKQKQPTKLKQQPSKKQKQDSKNNAKQSSKFERITNKWSQLIDEKNMKNLPLMSSLFGFQNRLSGFEPPFIYDQRQFLADDDIKQLDKQDAKLIFEQAFQKQKYQKQRKTLKDRLKAEEAAAAERKEKGQSKKQKDDPLISKAQTRKQTKIQKQIKCGEFKINREEFSIKTTKIARQNSQESIIFHHVSTSATFRLDSNKISEELRKFARSQFLPEDEKDEEQEKQKNQKQLEVDDEKEDQKKKKKKNKKKKKKNQESKDILEPANAKNSLNMQIDKLCFGRSKSEVPKKYEDALTQEQRNISNFLENLEIDDKNRADCKIDESMLQNWRKQIANLKSSKQP